MQIKKQNGKSIEDIIQYYLNDMFFCVENYEIQDLSGSQGSKAFIDMGYTADYVVYCAVSTHVDELGNFDNCNEYFPEHEEKGEYEEEPDYSKLPIVGVVVEVRDEGACLLIRYIDEEELHKHGGYNFFPQTIFAELSDQDNGYSPKCDSYGETWRDRCDFYHNGKYQIIDPLGATLCLSELEETRIY